MKKRKTKGIFRLKKADVSLAYIAIVLVLCVVSGVMLYGGKAAAISHIALYYDIKEGELTSPTGVTLAKAEQDMESLLNSGYTTILPSWLSANGKSNSVPNKFAMLVFNYSNAMSAVLDMLRSKGLNAVVVLNAAAINEGICSKLYSAVDEGYVEICVSADTPHGSVAATLAGVYSQRRIYMAGERLSMTNMLIAGEFGYTANCCMLNSSADNRIGMRLAAHMGFNTWFNITQNADSQKENRHSWSIEMVQLSNSNAAKLLCVTCIQVSDNTKVADLVINPHT